MAFTGTQLEALEAAIAKGVLRVTYQDRTVIYHTMKEMMDLRAAMKAEIATAAGTERFSRVAFSRR